VALSVNGQYFFRWLNNFRADGPLPLGETFDHGFETVVSQFVVPRKWELYGRTSFVFGQFRNSYEYAPGVKWYPVRNHRALAALLLKYNRIYADPAESVDLYAQASAEALIPLTCKRRLFVGIARPPRR
jgi:hypothetical protein